MELIFGQGSDFMTKFGYGDGLSRKFTGELKMVILYLKKQVINIKYIQNPTNFVIKMAIP